MDHLRRNREVHVGTIYGQAGFNWMTGEIERKHGLGNLVTFHFGYGVVAFTLCVAMSLVASMSFDPHAIWEKEEA